MWLWPAVRNVRTAPERFFLSANVPNPFNSRTQISYGLSTPGVVDMVIYDLLGRQVITLLSRALQPEGYYRIFWNGTDGTGRQVASGIYLYRLHVRPTNGGVPILRMRRMVLLR